MLFYREGFPISYQFAGCALIGQQWSPLSNEKWARVKVKYKSFVISHTRPLSTIAIIARRTFLLFSVQSYCSFPSTSQITVPHTNKISYVPFYWWRNSKAHLSWRDLIFVCNPSFNYLVTFVAIYPKQFVCIVFYQSLQQTSAAPCGALDVLMFANESRWNNNCVITV